MALQEQGSELSDMDYKFFFYPWFLDSIYELQDTFPINNETINYFNEIQQNEYVIKYFSDTYFTEAKMRWWQKKKAEQHEDMVREFPSYPKEAFDLAIKGAYYEKELSLARTQGRVGNVMYDPRIPV